MEALLESEDITPDALALHFALEKLPDRQRLPLILHYFEGFSIKETAIAAKAAPGHRAVPDAAGAGKTKTTAIGGIRWITIR